MLRNKLGEIRNMFVTLIYQLDQGKGEMVDASGKLLFMKNAFLGGL